MVADWALGGGRTLTRLPSSMPSRLRPTRSVVVPAVIFLAVLGLLAAIVHDRALESGRSPETQPTVTPFPSNLGPGRQTPPPDTPVPGSGYPVRTLGQLPAKATTVTGQGQAEVRYARRPSNGTAVHFTCSGCGPNTWLVETSRPWPLSGGPLPTPTDYTYMADTVDLVTKNSILVRADTRAAWTLTLTPFDALPLKSTTVTENGGAVLRLQLTQPAQLQCNGAAWAKTFSRPPGQAEYGVELVMQTDGPETSKISAPDEGDLLVATIDCPGDWTLVLA